MVDREPSEAVRESREQLTLGGGTTDEVEDGGIYRKKRKKCALVARPPQDQPCANCPDPCDRSESEGMILWMAAKMDLEGLMAFMWTQTMPSGEKFYEKALRWIDEMYAGPPPELPAEVKKPHEKHYYKLVRSYNEKQEEEPDHPVEHIQQIIRDHFGKEVSNGDIGELIEEAEHTEVNTVSEAGEDDTAKGEKKGDDPPW